RKALRVAQDFTSHYPAESRRMNQSRVAPTVFIIDDDADVRASIAGLLKSVGLRSEMFGTAQEFLRRRRPDGPSCLVLDVRLPGLNGLVVESEVAEGGVLILYIFFK